MPLLRTIARRLRPQDWWHFLSLPLAGALLHGAPDGWSLLWAELAAAGVLGHGFAYNTQRDQRLTSGAGWYLGPLILALGTLPLLPWLGRLAVLALLALSLLYSGPPRLKRLPLLSTLLNALGFPLLLLLGAARPTAAHLLLLGLLVPWIIAVQLIHELAHARADKAQRISTTALALGEKPTRWAIGLFLLAGVPVAWAIRPLLGGAFLAYALFVALAAHRLEMMQLRRWSRWLGLAWAALFALLELRPW
jgi:4-hydroxybenzoate polyprenyltransferase